MLIFSDQRISYSDSNPPLLSFSLDGDKRIPIKATVAEYFRLIEATVAEYFELIERDYSVSRIF